MIRYRRRLNKDICDWTVRSSDDDVEYVSFTVCGRPDVLYQSMTVKDRLPLNGVWVISNI